MNYIGSKQKLSPWIGSIIKEVFPGALSDVVFADIFAGTGQVARYMKPLVKEVITNDLESYSYVLNRHYIGNSKKLKTPEIDGGQKEGLFTKQFTEKASPPRKYFTVSNAEKIDAIRTELELKKVTGEINEDQYYWGLASLLEAADRVANTASVYGAFLKSYKKAALKDISFQWVPSVITNQANKVFQQDANKLIKTIKGDVLYLDPPYNQRQYGANYHVLNKLVDYKNFTSTRVTGLTDYNKSEYCKKDAVYGAFESLIKDADFEHIFISYNNEGLLNEKEFQELLKKYGSYSLHQKEYKRFKQDSARPNQAANTFEHLHVLVKK